MKLKTILLSSLFMLIGHFANAQCMAMGSNYQNGLSVNFVDSSYATNGYFTYWTFGDGSSSNSLNPSHTYASSGTYTVCLYIEDSITNCSDTTCWNITVSSNTSCSATFTYSSSFGNPLIYSFNGSAPPTYGSVTWNITGGGASSSYSTQNITHTFSSAGQYNVYYTLYDSTGSVCDSTGLTLYVSSPNTTSCDAIFSTYTSGNVVYFSDSTSSTNILQWSFGDGTYGYSSSPVHTYTSSGNYNACLFVYDVDSVGDTSLCDSFCQTVVASNQPSCYGGFNYTLDSTNNMKVYFNNTSVGAATAYWWFGGNNSSTLYNPSHTFATAGYHTVCLTTYDSSGNLCDSICQSIYVPQTSTNDCDATFYAYVSQNTVYFNDSLPPTNSMIQWSFGDGNIATSHNPSHTYASSGTYTVCLYVYDSSNSGMVICDSSCQTITVFVPISCQASYTFVVDSINMSSSSYPVYFTNTSSAYTYSYWSFGDGDSSSAVSPSHVYTSSGTYNACLFLIDSLGNICDTICQSITVGGAAASCQASYYLGIDSNNLYNIFVINNSTGTNSATSYFWTFGDGDSSSSQNPTHQYASYGLYNLCLTITTSSGGSTCTSMYCDSIGLDSNGMLLKRDGFGITVLNESDVLGINEHLVFQDVNVYPNPSTGLYTVELDMHSSKKITVRSMNSIGQEVMSADYNLMAGDNTLSLDLSEHTDGLYFINIKADNVSKNVRVYLIR